MKDSIPRRCTLARCQGRNISINIDQPKQKQLERLFIEVYLYYNKVNQKLSNQVVCYSM